MFKTEAIATRGTACLILSGILCSVSYAGTPAKVELTGDVHTTARTGYAGKTFPLGTADSKDHALWGLYSKETNAFSNVPCWVQVAYKSVNDDKVTGKDTKSLCGSKNLPSEAMGADFAPTDFTGPRAFVSGISICLNGDGDKIKGYTLRGRKINESGVLEDLTLKAAGPELANCKEWKPGVDCQPGEIATAAEIHYGPGDEPRSWIGIALKCRAVKAPTPAGTIHGVTTHSVSYPTEGFPFKALASTSGHVLVSVSNGTQSGVQVFDSSTGTLKSKCVNTIGKDPKGADDMNYFPAATDLTLGLTDLGAAFFHVSDLIECRQPPVFVARQPDGAGTLAAVVTPDGKFAFVLNEYGTASDGGNIAVVSIKRDSHGNFTSETRTLGYIPTAGSTLDGLALSRDGRRLFVSSEVGHTNTAPSSSGWPLLYRLSGCKQGPGTDMPSGIVSVVDVAKAVAHPDATAVISTIAAGCSPGRMALTSDGKVLWVSARGDNRVLAFSPAALETDPDHALLGFADTGGIAPVGIALFQHDQLLAVANSNRFEPTVPGNVTILNVANPAGTRLLTTVDALLFPREVTVGPDDSTLYVTDFNSKQLQVIETTVR